MDEKYDVVVCGTGLKECILSGILSSHGKKVLHVDRNPFYGGECASLNLTNLWEKFCPGVPQPSKEEYGYNRDWNVDLVPKFVMASGTLVSILCKTSVTKYLDWKVVDGTFVYQYQEAGFFSNAKFIHKVPATETEVLMSPLMGLMEKGRASSFFKFVVNFDETNPETWSGYDPTRATMAEVYEYFGLLQDTIDFMGHAVALYINDDYMTLPYGTTVKKMKLYIQSIARFGGSPFIYPIYGLGGLPEGFSRYSATYGGTYMLNTPVDGFKYDANGKVCGVISGNDVIATDMVICDPSYVQSIPNKVTSIGKVIRSICILGNPIPDTNDAASCQIIIPQSQLKRSNDVYVMMVSSSHCIAYKNKYVAMISTIVETADPEKEIKPAVDLLGPIEHQFTFISDLYDPNDDGRKDHIFVTKSYDATSHFESASADVLYMFKNITGEELDLRPLEGEAE